MELLDVVVDEVVRVVQWLFVDGERVDEKVGTVAIEATSREVVHGIVSVNSVSKLLVVVSV